MSTTQGVYRVLVAEDDPSTLQFLIQTLTGAGYLIDFCENGRDAFQMARQRSYALLITDLKMPHMSGDSLVRALRANGETLPALVISGSSTEVGEALVHEVEFVRFLPKPFSPAALLAVVSSMAGKVRG